VALIWFGETNRDAG